MRRDRYYTLMAALPALEPLAAEERPPCSRVHLERLLGMLEPEDAQQLEALEGLMFFDRLPFDLTDLEIVGEAARVLETIRSPSGSRSSRRIPRPSRTRSAASRSRSRARPGGTGSPSLPSTRLGRGSGWS